MDIGKFMNRILAQQRISDWIYEYKRVLGKHPLTSAFSACLTKCVSGNVPQAHSDPSPQKPIQMFFAKNSPILHDFHVVVQDSYAILDFCCSKPTSYCDFGVSFLHRYCYLFGGGVGVLHQFAFLVQQTYVTLPFWCMIPTPSFFIGQCFWCINFSLSVLSVGLCSCQKDTMSW